MTLGADHARGRWLAGLALLRSSGDGSYRDDGTGSRDVSRTCAEAEGGMDPEARAVPCDGAVREGDGTVEATLSAAVPYAALQASERIGLWGALGTGTGEVTLRPETGGALSSDLEWSMAAAGLRGDLLDGTGVVFGIASAWNFHAVSSDLGRFFPLCAGVTGRVFGTSSFPAFVPVTSRPCLWPRCRFLSGGDDRSAPRTSA